MKKTLITLMVLAGVAVAESETLTLKTPADGSLLSGNEVIAWEEDYSSLTSWELSFTLTDAALPTTEFVEPSDGGNTATMHTKLSNLFGTRTNGGGAGYLLSVAKDGSLVVYAYKTSNNVDDSTFFGKTGDGWITAATPTPVTLSFVADVNQEGTVVSGTFTLSSGTNSASFMVTDHLDKTSLGKDTNSIFWTNGGKELFSNITVKKLDNNLIVPEPATATLSLLALAGLAARRRRR